MLHASAAVRGRSQDDEYEGGGEKGTGGREGGNMWEGASHMDTGCCQDEGREADLSRSLARTHTLIATSRSIWRALSAVMDRKTLMEYTCIMAEDRRS